MGLLIAPDDNGNADGELFWDDGDSRGIISFLIFFAFLFANVLYLGTTSLVVCFLAKKLINWCDSEITFSWLTYINK